MSEVVVNTKEGPVKGCSRSNLDDENFFAFFGIPYAKPPLGKLRFKAPQPAEPWVEIRDATKEGEPCCQKSFKKLPWIGSEDCLHLNVYTKQLPPHSDQLKPVMVWIHGGAFFMGSNKCDMYDPEYLMTEDIVLVTINYRLGLLGFLKLEDPSLGVPGNAGLKDQTRALHWVQENIKHFGGDGNNVTIFGESAGGVSVHYHVLSPLSKGLFHKAIIQSGSALNPWVPEDTNVQNLLKIAGKESSDEKEGLEILQAMPVEELCQIQEEFLKAGNKDVIIVGPVIEKPNESAFLTIEPIEAITSGHYNKVPIMMGYCSNEGLVFKFFRQMAQLAGNVVEEREVDLEEFIPPAMGVQRGCSTSRAICQRLENLYYEGENASNEWMLHSDYNFVTGTIASAKNHVKTSIHPVFLYKMTLDAGLNVLKIMGQMKNIPGAAHGDDIGYLFKTIIPVTMGDLERVSVRRFVKLWTNFAKYGNPTPDANELGIKWDPVKDDVINYLEIGEDLSTHIDPEADRMTVWKEIFDLSPATNKYL